MRRLGVLGLLLFSLVLADGLGLNEKMLQFIASKYGDEARLRAENWRSLLNDPSGSEQEKLNRVNAFFNQVNYLSDFENWGKKDYWASPVEMLGVNAADCEDYAIAKYFTLTELGVPRDKLRITYVKAVQLGEAHMVLSYYPEPNEIPLILDNLKPEILPADQRKDLIPVYSFNADSIWAAIGRSSGKRLGGAEKLNLWKELRDKMKTEGQ